MNKSVSLVLSYVFHPLLMTTFTFILLYFTVPEAIKPLPIITLPFLFFTTFFIPMASLLMLKKLDSIKSLSMRSREERVMPFFFITLFYVMNAYMFIMKIHVSELVAIILIAISLLLLMISLITIWYKISIHAAGMAGSLGIIVAVNFNQTDGVLTHYYLGALVLSGLVMSARLALNAHTAAETWLGAALGFMVCFGTVFFYF